MNTERKKIICIVGPTAVGKSQIALQLAQELDTEIINADSRQFYQEFYIGTAKPSKEDRKLVVHHLIDCASIKQPWTVSDFITRVDPIVDELHKRKKIPIVVGGTGMYYRSFIRGLSSIPNVSIEIRKELENKLQQEGLAALYSDLMLKDPESAKVLKANDTQRIVRALEVFYQTGTSIREYWQRDPLTNRYEHRTFMLNLERKLLYNRINNRVERMIEDGLKQEVLTLNQEYPNNKLLRATIGYAEWLQYGFENVSMVIDKIKQNTRRFAKRQLTWFRKEEQIEWMSVISHDKVMQEIVKRVNNNKL